MGNLTLKQVIEFAKATDLKNLAIADKYPDMCNIVNMVLIDLHSRFTINQGIVDIPLEKDKFIYNINDYIKDV
ncbi:hypothetical protein ACNGB2_00515 [Campylobacter coli]|uniref:hypothetical protein n=1 Tax=Campylobacter coli TaxID=195 RepID=UPI0007072595|nr:hypothetical protein [Campylobacter coli]EAK0212318.1 hypothetical protein [Campylobacter jejuni]EAI2216800.1 hypothetical protein [Campylobacter coli]EAJ4518723.1 hypothetical protein [Campylobacter coli]EAK2897046.1 hypothetical protein [Campylobacter coli]EAL4587019.1 hypothetical protein [Campylobacter coli]